MQIKIEEKQCFFFHCFSSTIVQSLKKGFTTILQMLWLFNPYKKVSTTISTVSTTNPVGLFNPYKKVSTTMPPNFTQFRIRLFNPYKKVSTTIRTRTWFRYFLLFNPYKKVSTTILS